MLTRWLDDGIALKVELSTTGPLILGGNQTPIPFVAGGPSGMPVGWTLASNSSPIGQVNLTTDSGLNRFSISANATAALGTWYFLSPIYLPIVGHSFRVSVRVRTMDGKVLAWNYLELIALMNGSVVGSLGSVGGNTSSDWTNEVVVSAPWAGPPTSSYNQIQIRLAMSTRDSANITTPGIQFTELQWFDDAPTVQPDLGWRDITCDGMSVGIRYGRERFTQRYDIASCDLALQNDSGAYSYQNPHPFNLRPGRQLRVSVTYQAVSYPIFYGVIDALADGYSLDGHAISKVTAYDPQTLFANMNTPSLQQPNWPQPFPSGTRVNTLLNAIGWVLRTIDVGQWQQQAVNASGRTIRDELGVTADSEGGAVFADRVGNIVYKDRTWPTLDANLLNVTANLLSRVHSDTMITTIDGVPELPGAPIICTNQMNTDWGLDRLINYVELANAGGSMQVFNDKTSQAAYGIHSYQRLDFVNTSPADNLSIRANDIMGNFKDAALRVNSISYRPGANPTSWPWTLGVFLNWLVRVWYANPINEWGYAIVTHVQSIEHRITTSSWETNIALDQPIVFTNAPIIHWRPDYWQRGHWQRSRWQSARFMDDGTIRFDRSTFV